MSESSSEMGEKPTPEIEARGLKAYEQARAYERLRTWRLPLTYSLAPVLPAVLGAALWQMGYPALCAAGVCFSGFIALRVWLEWKRLKRQYQDNLVFLAKLEATYGGVLPWVQVEHHFAALEKLNRELAEEGREKSDTGS